MNQDSYKEFKIWDKELNRVYKLLYKGLAAKQKKSVKEKTDSLDKEKRKGSSQGSGTMGWRKRTAVGT